MFARSLARRWFVVCLPLLLVGSLACADSPRPVHEAFTQKAWEALNEQRYAEAVQHADKVIDEFSGVARRMQRELAEKRVQVPSGRVSEQQKQAIFSRGPLNDVTAAHFIRGRAAYRMGLTDMARQAFREAAEFTGARVWDPRNEIFWSPAALAARCVQDPAVAEKSSHELYTMDAWEAFTRGDYRSATRHADQCIAEFLPVAQKLQEELTRGRQQFAEGTVSDQEKLRILQNGILNDVGTCLFIKGKSAELSGNRRAAVLAFTQATKLTHARCWDPQGWFWSPATASADRLVILR